MMDELIKMFQQETSRRKRNKLFLQIAEACGIESNDQDAYIDLYEKIGGFDGDKEKKT